MRAGATGAGGPKREALIAAIASGMSWRDAADLVGVDKTTVARRMKEPEFRQAVAQERAARTERVLGALSGVALEAVNCLRELLSSGNDAVRASAVRTALQSLLQFSSAVTLEARIAALERQLGEQADRPVLVSPLREVQ